MVQLNRVFWQISKYYDAVVIGGGHNGLVAAAYLQMHGQKVCVLEKRHIVGGAAVTEEIIPDFKFSRAAYVLSLLRPNIYNDLKLENFGLNILQRDPSSYTPLREKYWKKNARSLTLGTDISKNREEISKFSIRDAANFSLYEAQLSRIAAVISPLLDVSPSQVVNMFNKSWPERILNVARVPEVRNSLVRLLGLGYECLPLYQFLTSPPIKILRKWFESEVLLATLAMDATIGTTESPNSSATGYVLLLHSILGDCGGGPGRWGIPVGGMGAVSDAIANSAKSLGVDIFPCQTVSEILVDSNGAACGVKICGGREVASRVVLSNATPHVTFTQLLPPGRLPSSFQADIEAIDYSSAVCKINVAVNRLPSFEADPNEKNVIKPHHQTTIHINCERVSCLENSYSDFLLGKPSVRPVIEMVIPSVLDPSVAPKDHHVVLLFTQYVPYRRGGWNDESKEAYASTVFSIIDEYAPGFSDSVIGKEVLTPNDLETTFGLTGGNIFHGAMSPDRLFLCRPATPDNNIPASPYTPVPNLFLCGSGSHPGGGVSGAPGRCCAQAVINYIHN